MIPQLIWIALVLLGFGINMAEHGQPKKGVNNAWVQFIALCISTAILYWGGFFDIMLKK